MALGDANYRVLSIRFGVTHQYVRLLAVQCREEIDAIKADVTEKEKLLWPVDRYARNQERLTDIARIEAEMAKHEEAAKQTAEVLEADVPVSEQWQKLLDQKHRILRAIQEDYAQVPLRVPAHRLGLLPSAPQQDMLPSTLAVYPEWDAKVHWVTPFDVPDHWARWWGVDFGFEDAFAWGNLAESPDGALYLVQEILMTHAIEEDHAREIVRLTAGQRMPQALVHDHDPSGLETLLRHMCRLQPAFERLRTVKAYKSVDEGIAAVRARLRSGRFAIFRNSLARQDPVLLDRQAPTCAAEEFPRYAWNGDGPVDGDDDALDMIRYVIGQIDLVGG